MHIDKMFTIRDNRKYRAPLEFIINIKFKLHDGKDITLSIDILCSLFLPFLQNIYCKNLVLNYHQSLPSNFYPRIPYIALVPPL